MKKIISAIICLSLVLALASCGSKDTESTESTASTASTNSVASVASTTSVAGTSSIAVSSTASQKDENTLNLAAKGTAIVDGLNENYSATVGVSVESLNDGDHSTRWQSIDKGEKLESEDNASWFGIKWDEAQTFDQMIMDWENAHPTEDGFRIQTSEDGEKWTDVKFKSVRTGTNNDGADTLDPDHQVDTVTLTNTITTKYIRVFCFTYYTVPEGHENAGNTKSPTSCYEIEIYNSADVDKADTASDKVSQ